MRKARRPMSEIMKDIRKNNRRKPTKKQLEELWNTLEEEGLAVKKAPTMLDKLPKNEGERLELMIRMTEKHTTDSSSHDYLRAQADRLRAQLAAWKKDNPS